jgi:fructosamine-3-kinase
MITDGIRSSLETITGRINRLEAVHGGSINACYRVFCSESNFFCKINSATKFPQLFEKEKSGLETLRANNILTPSVIACLTEDGLQVLVLEWIMQAPAGPEFHEKLAASLAALHGKTSAQFGFTHHNYMGAVLQDNSNSKNWTDFFINRRILPLLEKCSSSFDNGVFARFEKLFKMLPTFFPDKSPSLVHGDLWSGNVLCNQNQEPVLIDPAVYFGHPSVDIGMTELFGGFDRSLINCYKSHIKTDPNFPEQCEIANLYPLLIHLHLFGGHYRTAIENILRKYT